MLWLWSNEITEEETFFWRLEFGSIGMSVIIMIISSEIEI